MGRHRKVLKTQFIKAYERAENMEELASKLKVSIPTAYGYTHLYKRPIKTPDSKLLTLSIFRAYKGKATMEQLAVRFDLTRQAIRYQLWKIISLLNKKKVKIKWPLPQKLCHLKVLHLLDEQPDLFDYPDKIAVLTNLRQDVVEEYLRYAFEEKTNKHPIK